MMHKIYFWYKFHQKNQKMLSYIFFVYSWQLIYFNRVVFYYFDKKTIFYYLSFIMKTYY